MSHSGGSLLLAEGLDGGHGLFGVDGDGSDRDEICMNDSVEMGWKEDLDQQNCPSVNTMPSRTSLLLRLMSSWGVCYSPVDGWRESTLWRLMEMLNLLPSRK